MPVYKFLLLLAVLAITQCSVAHGRVQPFSTNSTQALRRLQRWFQPLSWFQLQLPVLLNYYCAIGSGAGLQNLQPQIHGYVHKAGMAERLNWSQELKYAVAREAVFYNWRQQERFNPAPALQQLLQSGGNLTCAAARHPPVPFHHCHVFVNHNYRIVYIRSPKSSSTSIINWLGQCRFNRTQNWNSSTCMEYSWEQMHSLTDIKRIWNDYFVFGFIRNPWNRAYSLYKDITGTNHFIHKHGPLCQIKWGNFCRDPLGEFDRVHSNRCGHVPPHYAYWHMMDQYHCMITPTGEWAVDFLGRVEQGDEDWKMVVDEMNKQRLPGVQEVQYSSYGHVHAVQPGQQPRSMPDHTRPLVSKKTARRSLRYFIDDQAHQCSDPTGPYCGDNAHCVDAVGQWFACDIDKFGYLPSPTTTPADQQQ